MFVRILCTVAVVALAVAGFMGFGPARAGFNAPGVILMIGAAFVWYAWPAGYSYHHDSRQPTRKRPDLITIGAAPLLKDRPPEAE